MSATQDRLRDSAPKMIAAAARVAPVRQSDIAVLIPCHNEALTIGQVVRSFKVAIPGCTVYVYDNNSKDKTREIAYAAEAVVCSETMQGKGHVVRRMFADIEADVYVLVDGDGTYDAGAVNDMISMLWTENLDMVTGMRVHESADAYRRGHQFGNAILTGAVRFIFGARISDMLSGYRVFSRRFVKSFPALSSGFETETELTVHALELRMPLGEQLTKYGVRPVGSQSKLRTMSDGMRIARTIIRLIKDERPLQFFSVIGGFLFVAGMGLGLSVVPEFIATGKVLRFPTAILATGIVLLSFLMFASGLILDSVALGRREMKRLHYLALSSPSGASRSMSRAGTVSTSRDASVSPG
jgi:glycosyltransferase involved in cell wall biosynthesis